jgi:hypothetical protein
MVASLWSGAGIFHFPAFPLLLIILFLARNTLGYVGTFQSAKSIWGYVDRTNSPEGLKSVILLQTRLICIDLQLVPINE